MPPKKTRLRRSPRRQPVGRTRSGASAKDRDSGLYRRLTDVTEQIDIMVPEVMARIAALEHLLLEKHVCTREDLVRAREVVRVLED